MSQLPMHVADATEHKLLTLQALAGLGKCTNMQLLRFMVENDIMTYFDLQPALYDMRVNGQILRVPYYADWLLEPTEAGLASLELYGGRVPASVQRRVAEACKAWRERIRRERSLTTYRQQEKDGTCTLHLMVLDGQSELMRLSLPLPDEELAIRLSQNWDGAGERIYQEVIRALAEKKI